VPIGVDPHKATHAVAAVNEQGELLEHASFCASRAGLRSLMRWAKRFEKRRWAVEGASGTSHLLAQHRVVSGERVVDVPAKLSARIRVLSLWATSARTTGWMPSTWPWLPGVANDYRRRWMRRSTLLC
jgi:hypothetical protein